MEKITYVLYGVAKRDRRETVCQFFDSFEDLDSFRKDLPGTYSILATNVDYDALEVEPVFEEDPKAIAKAEAIARKAEAEAERLAFVERLRSLTVTA